jgi:hypothetical protein
MDQNEIIIPKFYPAHYLYKGSLRNIRRRIKNMEFFALKLHRWFALGYENGEPERVQRQLRLF